MLLGPSGQMAFVRVAKQRITYVWRGFGWPTPRKVGDYRLYVHASFPDDQDDDANLVLTFGWDEQRTRGYQMRLRFDGSDVLAVAEGEPTGGPASADLLAKIVNSTYEDVAAWHEVLREIFAPEYNP